MKCNILVIMVRHVLFQCEKCVEHNDFAGKILCRFLHFLLVVNVLAVFLFLILNSSLNVELL